MDTQGATIGSEGLKKDRSYAQSTQQNAGGIPEISTPSVNGPPNHTQDGALPNGTPAPNGAHAIPNGEHADASKAVTADDGPPELDQTWRSTDANKSLGKLMDRLAQQCYFDLNDTLTKMAEKGPTESAPLTKGVVPTATQDTDNASLEKKRMLLEFAHDQRDRFIKTLVLSDWSRNEEEMARLIDIKVEQDKQRFAYKFAANSIVELKRRTVGLARQAPNIEGAIELLATSKAAWVPDLGYIPPKRLSARQLLRTLKDMNVTLATRLNLHEDLPQQMQEFTIANGRATFHVPGEFEVDLSVADEDPASTFYFIDIRLRFQPSPKALDERLRAHLETQVNEALRTRRLQGCYDFLHTFVLTHKINVLRSQAAELIRGRWFDCVSVETMRRNMVVRYWSGMPGPKSWFEIGVSSGKDKAGPRRKATPTLFVKWFRKGVEVTDEPLDFDWTILDLESYLATVIGKHAASVLGSIRERMVGTSSFSEALANKGQMLSASVNPKALSVDVPAAGAESAGAVLTLQMPSMRSPLTLRVDYTTGQYSISPPSAATRNCEPRMNNDPNLDVPRYLMSMFCSVLQEQFEKQAELLGWSNIQNLGRAQPSFGEDVFQRNVFYPNPSWGHGWGLGVSYGPGGETWWIVRFGDDKPGDRSTTPVKTVLSGKQMSVDETLGSTSRISSASLLHIERLAVAEVSFTVLSEQLRRLKIPHYADKLASAEHVADDGHQRLPIVSTSMMVRLTPLMQMVRGKTWKPWAADVLRLTHHGIESGGDVDESGNPALVRHNLRLSLELGKMKHLQQHLTHIHDPDIAINATGGLAMRLRTPFGKPFVEQIQTRLLNVARLEEYVATLQSLRFSCKIVSLPRLCFTYATAPQLSAQLTFSTDGSLPARLKLEPADVNPHLRIRVMLEKALHGESWFRSFALSLSITLPLLRTFENLEAKHLAKQSLIVRPRSPTWYHLSYKAPYPPCIFQVRARSKTRASKHIIRWHVEAAREKVDGSKVWPEDLTKALKELWQEKGEGWFGIGNGAIANVNGVALVLEKLDQVVRRFPMPEDPSDSAPGLDHQLPAGESRNQPVKSTAAGAKSKKEPDVIMLDD